MHCVAILSFSEDFAYFVVLSFSTALLLRLLDTLKGSFPRIHQVCEAHGFMN